MKRPSSAESKLTRSIDGEADKRFLAGVDKVVLASLGDDDKVTGVDHLLLSGDDGLALTLSEDQVLVDVVNLQVMRMWTRLMTLNRDRNHALNLPLHRCLRRRGWSSRPIGKIHQSTRPFEIPRSWRGTQWSSWGSVASR